MTTANIAAVPLTDIERPGAPLCRVAAPDRAGPVPYATATTAEGYAPPAFSSRTRWCGRSRSKAIPITGPRRAVSGPTPAAGAPFTRSAPAT